MFTYVFVTIITCLLSAAIATSLTIFTFAWNFSTEMTTTKEKVTELMNKYCKEMKTSFDKTHYTTPTMKKTGID